MVTWIHPTSIALMFFLIMLVIGSAIQWTFLIKLKKHHSILWVHAGKPTIINNGDLVSAWGTTRYLMNRDYNQSENDDGIRFCESFRGAMFYGYFLTASSVPIFIFSIFVFGWPEGLT